MKVLIFIPIFLFVNLTIHAQRQQDIATLFEKNELQKGIENNLLFITREPIAPNLEHVKWEPSVLVDFQNGYHKVNGYYNHEDDEINILFNDLVKTIVPQKIKAIKMGAKIYLPSNFKGEECIAYSYFLLLSDNKIALLKHPSADGNSIYYTRRQNEPALPLKLSRKFILKAIDDTKTSDYLRSNKLGVKSEEELIHIFDFYNDRVK